MNTENTPVVGKGVLKKFSKAEAEVTSAISLLHKHTEINTPEEAADALAALKNGNSVEKVIEAARKALVKPYNDTVKDINAYAKSLTEQLPPAINATKKALLTYQEKEELKEKQLRAKGREAQLINLGYTHLPDGDDQVKGNTYRYGDNMYITWYAILEDADDVWAAKMLKAAEDIQRFKDAALQTKQQELDEAAFFGTEEEQQALQSEIEDLSMPASTAVPIATSPAFVPASTGVKGLTKRWVFEVTSEQIIPRQYLQVNEKAIREAIAAGVREIPGVRIYQDKSISIR